MTQNKPQIQLETIHNIFFIGIAGSGMSAIAQYLAGIGKQVAGSDRSFVPYTPNNIRKQLQDEGIACHFENGTGVSKTTQLVVVSTAIEDSSPDVQRAQQLNIRIVKRAELLAAICATKRGIAVAGTSGKSTTTAMLFDILSFAGLEPSLITGAGLIRLQKQGKIGNAVVGRGSFLLFEADESDGSLVHYKPEIGLIMNIDKDHKEIKELVGIFDKFRKNVQKTLVVNASNRYTMHLSQHTLNDYSTNVRKKAGYRLRNFVQNGFNVQFDINRVPFELPNVVGLHNAENALAATAVAAQLGIGLATCAEALKTLYQGIYRRNQVLGCTKGVWVIDDFAHNPAKVRAAIHSWQQLSDSVWAWFQPHGFAPTKFLRHDFVKEIAEVLRPSDHIIFSKIYYAGGTVDANISAEDLVNDLVKKGVSAHYIEDRKDLSAYLKPKLKPNDVVLLMGARDPSLDEFANVLYHQI